MVKTRKVVESEKFTCTNQVTLSIQKLGKIYTKPEIRAVENFNLELKEGEIISIVGPSGSGKSTILQMLGGHTTPTTGKIFLYGKDIISTPAYKRPIHTIFQELSLFPHMNVKENIEFPLRMLGINKAEIIERVNHILETVHLKDFETRNINSLSGGQKQRVAIARSVVSRPKVLLCDEPLSKLEANLKEELLNFLIYFFSQQKISTIYVTHDQSEALLLSNRIIVLNNGNIVQIDTPQNILEKPENSFVAKFFMTHNIFEGEQSAEGYFISDNLKLKIPVTNRQIKAVGIKPENLKLRKDINNTEIIKCKIINKLYRDNQMLLRGLLEDGRILSIKINNFNGFELNIGEETELYYCIDDVDLFEC